MPESIVEDNNIDLNCKFIRNAFDHYSADLKFDFSDSAAEPDLQKIKRKLKTKKARSTSQTKRAKTDENIPTKL